MPTPHIEASPQDINSIVIMPGDPLRAQFIAENFLSKVTRVNAVRNMYGYSGYSNNKPITIQSSGMGMPSMGIYAHELVHMYNAKYLIRVGTMGAIHPSVSVGDLVIATNAVTDSNFGTLLGFADRSIAASSTLMQITHQVAANHATPVHFGTIWTSDHFYGLPGSYLPIFKEGAILGVEMETFALYLTARLANIDALAIYTITDDEAKNIHMSPSQRVEGTKAMVSLALEIADQIYH